MTDCQPISIRRLDTRDAGFERALSEITGWTESFDSEIERRVAEILKQVKERGDHALLELTNRLDQRSVNRADELVVSTARIDAAMSAIDGAMLNALQVAAQRIRDYHRRQFQESWQMEDEHGNTLGQQITPLERVGIYVPGGKASYPSSVLMNCIPARVAGVDEVVMTVPAPRGELSDLVLAAASIAGVDRVITVGGAQAIAALAFGTETVPRVDKIVGPGNIYVATAKRMVFGTVGLDMVAGPSEILVICDGKTDPDWIAMDLFSQAEHDEQAQAILLSWDDQFLQSVCESIHRLLPSMQRRDIIRESLTGRGALVRVRGPDEACAISNRLAPEHLELSVGDARSWLPKIRNAGAIFLGRRTPEALGDYCAGPNHVLPTSATARFSSPLGVYDFQKRSSIIYCSETGAAQLGGIAATLARGESLTAHARSAEMRIQAESDGNE